MPVLQATWCAVLLMGILHCNAAGGVDQSEDNSAWIKNVCQNETSRTTAESGVLHHWKYPEGYAASTCRWYIFALQRKSIKLDFNFVSYPCDSGVNLRVEEDDGFVRLDNVCGTVKPPTLYSFGWGLRIIFSAKEGSTRRNGMLINYTMVPLLNASADPCSFRGTRLQRQGQSTSPGFREDGTGSYASNLDCKWILTDRSSYSRVILNMTHFKLEPRQDGVYDWLDIYDGSDFSAPKIGRFSGSDTIPIIRSNTDALFLHFKTDAGIAANGFRFTFKVGRSYPRQSDGREAFCQAGENVAMANSGSIKFPVHGCAYHDKAQCAHKIITSPGTVMQIIFLTFAVEADDICRYDHLTLYDGPDADSPILSGPLCGEKLPIIPLSSSNQVYMVFKADPLFTKAGYRFVWYQQDDSRRVTGDACSGSGQVLSSSSGVIASPGYFQEGPGNAVDCKWTIQAPEGGQVALEWHMMNTSACPDASLQVYDGASDQAPLLRRYCGYERLHSSFKSSGRELYVSLHTDGTATAYGTFYTIPRDPIQDPGTAPGCSGEPEQLTAGSYELTSPAYDGVTPYGAHAQCTWMIFASNGKHIKIHFDHIDLEYFVGCPRDSIKVYSGLSATESALAAYRCGKHNGSDVHVSSNKAVVLFRTDSSGAGTGFHATWREVQPTTCGVPDPEFPILPESGRAATIVGGTTANAHSLPWQILFVKKALPYNTYCGGSMLTPELVLSAAHCFISFETDTPFPAEAFKVVAGAHHRKEKDDAWQVREIRAIYTHRNYTNCRTHKYDYDIALIYLKTPLILNKFVQPVCIPRRPSADGTPCLAAGWGKDSTGGFPDFLNQVYLPIIKQSTCVKYKYYDLVTDRMLCAGVPKGEIDSCSGDSGGPFICPRKSGAWALQGVVSWGVGCARPMKPGVYTRVTYMLPWLQEHGSFLYEP